MLEENIIKILKINSKTLKLNKNFDYIQKNILITNFQISNIKKLIVLFVTSLSKDLKYIYKKFKKDCVSWNCIIYINIQKN